MKEFIDIIKSDKKSKILFIITIGVLFICTVSYSLSIFSNNKEGKAANIIVNGLSFNMTTNTGETDDRILKLKANTLESFNVVLTNLNTMDVKYELIYEVCTDNSCTSTLDKLPDDVVFGIHTDSTGKITDTLIINGNTNIFILSNNNTNQDYYIKLNLNAGYSWNELALINQIDTYHKDIDFIAYVDGVKQSNFPNSCDYIYTYKTYKNGVETTDSEVTLTCSNNTWNLNVTNVPNKVNVWFKSTLKSYIASLDKSSNGLEEDTTSDKNLRYVGETPKNYIKFNNETWRIIGIVDGYVKIIRQDRITDVSGNNEFAWDSSNVNDWTTASLQTYLNGDYYNSLSDIAKSQIQARTWNLGGWSLSSASAADMYSYERGTTVYEGNPAKWPNGNIALMYPSDWGYASKDTSCRSDILYSNCSKSNWMYTSRIESGIDTSQYDEWTLSTHSTAYASAFCLLPIGRFYSYYFYVSNPLSVRPVLHLKSNVYIINGDGASPDTAYEISLN